MSTTDYAIADTLMHVYLEHRRRRDCGETTGVRAISFALSGVASACCGAPPTLTKKLVEVCYTCRRQCEWRTWSAPRERRGQGDGIHTMVIRETTSRRSDVEETLRLREALLGTRAAKLIEPRPRDMSDESWEEHLYAWSLFLLSGSLASAVDYCAGSLREGALRDRIFTARRVVKHRAERRPYDVRAALEGVRISGGSGARLSA